MPPYSKKAKYIHKVVQDKNNFDSRSFRTIPLGKSGKKALVGCPAGFWMPRKKRCKVGMEIQKKLIPKKLIPKKVKK